MSQGSKINVAIAGGGIAGLCLARGLLACPNIKVTVYEATAKYLDIGGGLAFHGNAMRALELIDPELQAEYFRRATLMSERDVEMSTEVRVGDVQSNGDRGKLLAELGKAKGRKTVARSDLLDGLLSLIPEGVVHFSKRLHDIKETDNGIDLTFKDGSSAQTDVLIGCDGVHSLTRTYLLGADHPATKLQNHDNWVWHKRIVPAEEVRALNPGLLNYVPILCGHGGYMNCIPIHFGNTLSTTVVQKGASNTSITEPGNTNLADGDKSTNGHDDTDKLDLSQFKTWSKDARDIAELTSRAPLPGWKLQDQDPAPFYARRHICMAGDAAHATMPFNGQGAAQSIEDACVLTAVFKEVENIGQVAGALRAYEAVRMPRSQKVQAMSRRSGRMYSFLEEGIGDDVGKLMKELGEGAKYTNEVDLIAQNEAALKLFRRSKAPNGTV